MSSRRKLPWWGKWLGIPLLILGVFAAVWGSWQYHASVALRAEVEKIRSRGEPLRFEDIPQPAVAPEKNAAIYVREAGQEYTAAIQPQFEALRTKIQNDGRWVWIHEDTGLMNYPAFRNEYADDLHVLLTASEGATKKLREARTCPAGDWELNYRHPYYWIHLPGLGPYRFMAKFLSIAAMVQHDRGQDSEAVESIQDILVISGTVDDMPSLITLLTSYAIESVACDAVEILAPQLVLSPDNADTRRRIQALITRLLDETSLTESLRNSMIGERLIQYSFIEDYVHCRMSSTKGFGFTSSRVSSLTPVRVLLRPMLTMDEARSLRYLTAYVDAAGRKDYPSAMAIVLPPPEKTQFLYSLRHPFSDVVSDQDRIFFLHYRCIAQRRMAAVALAVRLYRIDHGTYPAKLDELVPGYLPAVPTDPFDAKAAPLRYLPDEQTPVVYSVGENGVDDGGLLKRISQTTPEPNGLDLVFLLYLRPTDPLVKALRPAAPTKTPATQPSASPR